MERQEQSVGPVGPEGGSVVQKGNNGDLLKRANSLVTKLIHSQRAEDWRRTGGLFDGMPELWEDMPKVAKDFEFDRTQDGEGPGLEDLDGVSAF